MPTLLIHPSVDDHRFQRLAQVSAELRVVNAKDPSTALAEMPAADAFFGKITPELLTPAENLRWVQCPTASLEHYLFPALVDHPCTLTNMRGLYSDVIAEHVIGFLLCFSRNLHHYLRTQSAAHWSPVGEEGALPDFSAGPGVTSPVDKAHRQLGGATLGIVGLGEIGRELARRAAAFDMRIVAVDEILHEPPKKVERLKRATADGLSELLSESDYVVITAPHTPATERMFARAQFQTMKSDAILVNIGRGAIVVLNDLVASLKAGEIGGAALDVFETEPLPRDHPLWQMPNVILTPHVAGTAPVIAQRHLDLLLDNVRRFVTGQPLRNVADKSRWF